MYRTGVLLVVCAVLALLVIFFSYASSDNNTPRAQDIISACDREGGGRAECYEERISALYPELAVPSIFGIIREVRHRDRSYQFCHVLAHKLGERVVAEDPDRWLDAIPLNPSDGLCSNGFIHGVVGGRFRSEVLDDETLQRFLPDFRAACEARGSWNPSDLDRAICYHGLGHLYDFITDADIPKALDVCEKTAPHDMRRVCIEGVFMQIYQPLEPDDFLMIERMTARPSTTTVRMYCARFSDDSHEGACLRESWPYAREGILSGRGARDFCSGQPNVEEERKCYESISAIVGRMSLDDVDKAVAACSSFPSAYQSTCFAASAQAVLEESRLDGADAIALCDRAGEPMATKCKSELASRALFIYGDNSSRREAFCALIPESARTMCSTP